MVGSIDRLPTRAEMVFDRERKALYLRLSKVIRSLSTKVGDSWSGKLLRYNDFLGMGAHDSADLPFVSTKGRMAPREDRVCCLYSEVSQVVRDFWVFLERKSGHGRYTNKIKPGIERLEWINDNWDDLIIEGDLRNGFELILGVKA